MNEQVATKLLHDVLQIETNEKPFTSKYLDLKRLVEHLAFNLTKNEKLQFSNFFSKLSFICNEHKISTKIHAFRKTAHRIETENYQPSQHEYYTHLKYVSEFIASIAGTLIPAELMYYFPEKEYYTNKAVFRQKLKKLRVQIIEVNRDCLICDFEDNDSEDYIQVQVDEDGINEKFTSVHDFWVGAQLNLVNVTIDDEGVYHPRFIILEPDYLVDISAIAECFQDYGTTELHYLKGKFEEVPNSKHIRLGNFANTVVDQLTTSEADEVSFMPLLIQDFKNFPLEYTTCKDLRTEQGMYEYVQEAKGHFDRIKKVMMDVFPSYQISLDRVLLEPSFLCEQYGIQGRLDILDLNPEGKNKIVELKSGGTPFPDDGKSIKVNHLTQLFLYFQLVGVLYELEFKDITQHTDGYILYSKVYEGNLRLDVPTITRVQRIFDLRNRLLINEHRLAMNSLEDIQALLYSIKSEQFIQRKINPKFRELLEQQFDAFLHPLRQSTPLERTYFYSFTGFIAKEHYLAKLGLGQHSSNNGLANLWLNSFEQKSHSFEILYDLTIVDNKIDQEQKEIVLARTNPKNDFTSLREGDICILYPRNKIDDNALSNQVFKCSIQSITKLSIVLNFRHKQPNTRFFEQFEQDGKWALERDFMDSGFQSMYRNLYGFIRSMPNFKQLLLNQRSPKAISTTVYQHPDLSEEQNRILQKALNAEDYFLLNGPPGTGKTSIIIKELVKELFMNTPEKVLLLAYTNRAVDELCESINHAIEGTGNKFIRIGSELSCSDEFKPNLLKTIIQQTDERLQEQGKKINRHVIEKILTSQRIFVSTVASIASRTDLLDLKRFDTIIIDEASQILEPQIIGILPKAKRFIMIGDHKQLPAIVLQSPELSKTNESSLEEIGLINRKNSLFERLYTFCEKEEHLDAYDQLTFQGRMHAEIAEFPNAYFYDSKLNVAFDSPHHSEETKLQLARQRDVLNHQPITTDNALEKILCNNRLAFFDVNPKNSHEKANEQEALLIALMVEKIQAIYKHNQMTFHSKKTIGIIAPFRNQIALIKQKLEEQGIPNFEFITVDTVERYQGSQRDIIIYSFAVTNPWQLEGVVNLNDDGTVDRKLNVALTRAKEQLFIIGNEAILNQNKLFSQLIGSFKAKGNFILQEDLLV